MSQIQNHANRLGVEIQGGNGFELPVYDTMTFGYSEGELTSIVYKKSGSTVATLTFAYDGSDLTSITKS